MIKYGLGLKSIFLILLFLMISTFVFPLQSGTQNRTNTAEEKSNGKFDDLEMDSASLQILKNDLNSSESKFSNLESLHITNNKIDEISDTIKLYAIILSFLFIILIIVIFCGYRNIRKKFERIVGLLMDNIVDKDFVYSNNSTNSVLKDKWDNQDIRGLINNLQTEITNLPITINEHFEKHYKFILANVGKSGIGKSETENEKDKETEPSEATINVKYMGSPNSKFLFVKSNIAEYFYIKKDFEQWKLYVVENLMNRRPSQEYEGIIGKFFEILKIDNPSKYKLEKPALIEWNETDQKGFLEMKGLIKQI